MIRSLPREVAVVGFGLEGDRTRDVKRNFEISDHAITLAKKPDEDYCRTARNVEFIYPMGGQKNIRDLIENFIFINLDSDLEGSEKKPNICRMGDTILFRTRLTNNLAPGFTITTSAVGTRTGRGLSGKTPPPD